MNFKTTMSVLSSSFVLGAAGLASQAVAAPLPAGYTCVGGSVCGTLGADGNVTVSPQGGDYGYVSTAGAVGNNGNLGIGAETNSSVARTPIFASLAGDALEFFFNYVTSDGSSFIEYSWVKLINAADSSSQILFTARTTPTGDTVPGFGLPGLAPGVTLTPGTTAIIANQTNWSPLGSYSGSCFGPGCGQTGWIGMNYSIANAGNYFLEFGVVNWSDQIYDSGLAFDGITIAGNPINPVPEPAGLALLGVALAGLGVARAKAKKAA
jgi:hypothetical protein